MDRQTQHIAFLIGRLILGGVYLWSGIANLLNLDGRAAYAAAKGVPVAHLGVVAASLLLLLAGASLVTGIRPRAGVSAITLFLIPVTPIMHNFWAVDGLERVIELHNFVRNLGLLGSALIFLAIPQPWPLSLQPGAAKQGSVGPQELAGAPSIAPTK